MSKHVDEIKANLRAYEDTSDAYALDLKLSFARILIEAREGIAGLLDDVENLENILCAEVNLDFETAGKLLHACGIRVEFRRVKR